MHSFATLVATINDIVSGWPFWMLVFYYIASRSEPVIKVMRELKK